MAVSGYSGTPLAKKLGIRSGFRVLPVNAPNDYFELISPRPEGVVFLQRSAKLMDIVHFFTCDRSELERRITGFQQRITPAGMIWVSWPKKASRVKTDITEDVIRSVCLPLGLVDIKVCAVDAVWSGLKLVIRRELR